MGKRKHFISGLFIMLAVLMVPVAVCADTEPVTAKIPVSCVGKNTGEEFSYILSAEDDSGTQHIGTDHISLSDGETGSFTVTFSYPDTYRFKVWQEAGSDQETIYDDTFYHVDVYVTENGDGRLFAEPVIYKRTDASKSEDCKFLNEKVSPSSQPAGTAGSGNVKTGDDTDLELFTGLLLASFMTLGIGVIRRRKKSN